MVALRPCAQGRGALLVDRAARAWVVPLTRPRHRLRGIVRASAPEPLATPPPGDAAGPIPSSIAASAAAEEEGLESHAAEASSTTAEASPEAAAAEAAAPALAEPPTPAAAQPAGFALPATLTVPLAVGVAFLGVTFVIAGGPCFPPTSAIWPAIPPVGRESKHMF